MKKVATGAQLRFWLSEPAQVSIALVRKGAKSSTASTVVQAPAGTRSFVLRTRALRKGTYTVDAGAGRRDGQQGRTGRQDAEGRQVSPFRAPADAWSRRDFMRNGFGSIALLCTVATPGALRGRSEVTSAALRAQARSPFEPFQRDLPRLPELLPVNSAGGKDTYEVAIREGMAEVLPGFQTPIYGYEGVYPGPLIRARKGREAVVRQKNTLPFETNVHLHGGYVPAPHDGHPMDVIPAGKSFDYHYPNDQDAATLWYHDHAHGRTAHTLYYGLVGMYIVQDELEERLNLPRERVRSPDDPRRSRVQ